MIVIKRVFIPILILFTIPYTQVHSQDSPGSLTTGSTTSDPCEQTCPTVFNPVCGSDGKTYSSECALEVENCKSNSDITIASEGECPEECIKACTRDLIEVCGSDGQTYPNECALKNAQCEDASLKLVSKGKCPTTTPSPPPTTTTTTPPSSTTNSPNTTDSPNTTTNSPSSTPKTTSSQGSKSVSKSNSGSGSSTPEPSTSSSSGNQGGDTSKSGTKDSDTSDSTDPILSPALIGLLIVGIVIIILIAVWCGCCYQRYRNSDHDDINTLPHYIDMNTPSGRDSRTVTVTPSRNSIQSKRASIISQGNFSDHRPSSSGMNPLIARPVGGGMRNSSTTSPPMTSNDLASSRSSMIQTNNAAAYPIMVSQLQNLTPGTDEWREEEMLTQLTSDEKVMAKIVPLPQIAFIKKLSQGAFGEVWLCNHFDLGDVAVKKLLDSKKFAIQDMLDYVVEIRLTASLDHPNIIKYLGASWENRSLSSLCMVMEYMPRGDLMTFLRVDGDMISWVREKLPMAVGVAKALKYLHALPSPVIHRDLKTKNIMLTPQFDVKLIDFGVSRQKIDETMTAAVGTPYWAAPEVLDSRKYDEKSDIYSFGIFLSELDTCNIPYHDARNEEGEKLSMLKIVNMVLAGQLTPTFTPDCPPRIKNLAVACLNLDPTQRPTASEVVAILTGQEKLKSMRGSNSTTSRESLEHSSLSNSATASIRSSGRLATPLNSSSTRTSQQNVQNPTNSAPIDITKTIQL